ncbi:hypothetical protein DQ353_14165 [Arthrobacter sp. AQ5-05]|uniref:hypothetical protein n=1 Tax=Arthrobacter sp. AQ5-05 TaxID=2184581 RepID=UPI000DCD356D|nr:hypothetical protein [Arthrobacter sp. AQ5-05]RAX48673.1 hypothetical protein DQ353_14165 [Arthrobacter sp. AQ5-05]
MAFNGAGVPLEYLQGSPFGSFPIPGIILGGIVGGTQIIAAASLLAHRPASMLLSAIAGFGMLIWVFVELAIILAYSFLQTLYFGLGVLELALVLVLLGITPSSSSPLHRLLAEAGCHPLEGRRIAL